MRRTRIAVGGVLVLSLLAVGQALGAGAPGVQDYLSGLGSLQDGNWSAAIAGLNKAIAAEPENADYYTARGVAEALAQKLTDAQHDLERANRLRPNHKMTQCWLASVVAMQGRFMQDSNIFPYAVFARTAQDNYFNAVRAMSHDYGQLTSEIRMYGRKWAQDAQPKRAAALRQFKTLAAGFVKQVEPSGGALSDAIKERGNREYQAGQFADAYRDLSVAYQANPQDADVLYHLACCEMMTGRLESARRHFTMLLTAEPHYTYALIGRALVLGRLGDAPGAKIDFDLAKKLVPKMGARYDKEFAGYLKKAQKLSRRQRAALLEDMYTKARQGAQQPELYQLAQQIIRACAYGRVRADERYQRRLNALRAKATGPHATAADWTALGQFLYTEAFRVVGEAVEPHAPNTPYHPQTRASEHRELEGAEWSLNRALKLNPNDARALAFKAGCIFSLTHDWQTSEALLEKAVALAPTDSDILEMMARVLDYAAFVQTTAAAQLRSNKFVGEDAYYIYYRAPSPEELRRADQLDAMAKRMWQSMYQAMVAAIKAHPGSAASYYYQALLSERNTDYKTAAANLRYAVKLKPDFLDAWEHLWTDLGRSGQRAAMYQAQVHAVNFVQTSAAPLLKEVWGELNRTAYETCAKLLDEAARYDAADPRVAAYRGCVARAQGHDKTAAAWFVVADVLEQAHLGYRGADISGKSDTALTAAQVAPLMAYNNAGAAMADRLGKPHNAVTLTDFNFNLYRRLPVAQKYVKSPAALLPAVEQHPDELPEAPTLECLTCWSAVYAGRADVALGHLGRAEKRYEWATAFEARKPATMDQGMAVRVPGKWATLGLVDVALREHNPQLASQRMQMFGYPSFITPAMQAQADRLRNALDAAGYRSGGMTAHDMLDRMRRHNGQNP